MWKLLIADSLHLKSYNAQNTLGFLVITSYSIHYTKLYENSPNPNGSPQIQLKTASTRFSTIVR